jgi:hypothetical protein
VTPARRLSPTAELELWAWYQARKALGTFKTKARELGVVPTTISESIYRLRVRNGETIRKRDRNRKRRRK